MRAGKKLSWLLAAEAGVLLILPFPVAGPLPHWRAALAWIALVPLLIALLVRRNESGWQRVGRNTLLGYFSGILWYAGTCYWIESTMQHYGNLSAAAAAGILVLFCLFLAIYMALFALLVSLTQRATGNTGLTLLLVPFLWAAVELACARVTSFPWDQLGYSEIDNLLLTRLAPWTGNYGLSFVIVAVNCAIAGFFLLRSRRARMIPAVMALLLVAYLQRGFRLNIPAEPAPYTAVLLQPNLNVGAENNWSTEEFARHTRRYAELSEDGCEPFFAGLPLHSMRETHPACTAIPAVNLVMWPESPAPFLDNSAQFRAALGAVANTLHAPVIAGDISVVRPANAEKNFIYNSATFIAPDGSYAGRYDKMHLVPFGEYVPFAGALSFAGSLTEAVGQMTHGTRRVVFAAGGHRYGVFICYESIFADEVRRFVGNGADVLVNISDDGWYGNSSAPWQHLNIARMRAIENDRWLLRDTNTGITTVIDPHGRVIASAPRHVETSLLVRYGAVSRQTFYTRHGDLFASLCGIIALVLAAAGAFKDLRRA